ncbi:MAG: sensor histidine kinase [Candidatus Heimdallarchaeaceae archaeon]
MKIGEFLQEHVIYLWFMLVVEIFTIYFFHFFFPFFVYIDVINRILIVFLCVFVGMINIRKRLDKERRVILYSLTLSMFFLFITELMYTIDYFRNIIDVSISAELLRLLSYLPLGFILIRRIKIDFRVIKENIVILIIITISTITIFNLPMVELILIYYTAIPIASLLFSSLLILLDSIVLMLLNAVFLLYYKLEYSSYWIAIIAGYYVQFFSHLLFSFYYVFGIYEVASFPDVLITIFYSTILAAIIWLISKDQKIETLHQIEKERNYYRNLYQEIDKLGKDYLILSELFRHDLVNDLAVIDNSLELYKETGKNKFLEMSLNRIRSMQEKPLLNLTKDLTHSMKLDFIHVSSFKYLQNVFPSLKVNFPKKELTIRANILLNSVLYNIIENAYKHGGDKVKGLLNIKEAEDAVLFEIIDNGKGISDELKTRIFGKYFTTNKTRGKGLGLYYAKQIIENYGGSIEVKDNKPQGTRFIIRIPTNNKNH